MVRIARRGHYVRMLGIACYSYLTVPPFVLPALGGLLNCHWFCGPFFPAWVSSELSVASDLGEVKESGRPHWRKLILRGRKQALRSRHLPRPCGEGSLGRTDSSVAIHILWLGSTQIHWIGPPYALPPPQPGNAPQDPASEMSVLLGGSATITTADICPILHGPDPSRDARRHA
ncbi:hypothetical protein C8Q72DRAFT_566905 [Fomitopsis betulina]|nr:hypothetical protein C8Q72DRAFT_566905 [Fomitopsis betulina]